MVESSKSPEKGREILQEEECALLNKIVARLEALEFGRGQEILRSADGIIHDYTDQSDPDAPLDYQVVLRSMNAGVILHLLRSPQSTERKLEVYMSLPGTFLSTELMYHIEECLDPNSAVATSITEICELLGGGEPSVYPTPDIPPFMPGGLFHYSGRTIRFTGAYDRFLLFIDIETRELLSIDRATFREMAEKGTVYPTSNSVSQFRRETHDRVRQLGQ